MKEYELNVLEQYHIEVNGTRKIRGAILCDTNQGWLLLREAVLSEKRVPMLLKLYSHLEECGYNLTDKFVTNEEGNVITVSEDGGKYILKRWFHGHECDTRRENEIMETTRHLAKLHYMMQGILEPEDFPTIDLKDEYVRHNRELKKVRSFIRNKVGKGEFESAFLECFDPMYYWADTICGRFEQSGYDELYNESVKEKRLVHGDYNYHNVLMLPEGIATTNFEHLQMDIQAADFYYLLRKSMEKHQWDVKLGERMLDAYSRIKPLSKDELEYIALRMAYPEKFWKIANTYYRSNKAWIPVKNLEKLKMAIKQTEEKRKFLQDIFAFHL